MTETATAASAAPVAPAAPVVAAAPAAPAAVAPVAPATEEGTSLLDAAPAAPATPAAPAAPAVASTPAEALAAAKALVAADAEATRLAADPNSGKAWNLNDTTPGTGEKPGWFKSDKYKNVSEQAKAYPELEKQLGAFTGAPRDEKGQPKAYDLKLPEGVSVDMTHPMMVGFNDWAVKNNVSNDKFNDLLGQLASYEASQQVPMASVLTQLGADAHSRIANVVTWTKANLGEAGFQLMRSATGDGKTAAATFAVLEQMISKTGQVRMPKPGDDSATPGAQGLAAIDAMQAAKNAKGQRLYEIDGKYRQEVEKLRTDYFAANPVVRDRQGNRRG